MVTKTPNKNKKYQSQLLGFLPTGATLPDNITKKGVLVPTSEGERL